MKRETGPGQVSKLNREEVEISIVVPVFMGQHTITELYIRLKSMIKALIPDKMFEIILVEDNSSDETWKIISEIAFKDNNVVAVKLSRNFGQHAAITAGLNQATGNWIVVMDCDLQDVPEEIPKMYAAIEDGYQIIIGKKDSRKDPRMKILTSRVFSFVYRKLTSRNLQSNIGNFGIYSKNVIQSILSMPEQNRSFGLLALWVGFKRKEVLINHAPRTVGRSNYNFTKRLTLALASLVSYSNKILNVSIYLGLFISTSAFLFAIWFMIDFIIYGNSVTGWTSTVLLILFSMGIQLTMVGIIALYVGKIFDETKHRPIYLIEEIIKSQETKMKNLNSCKFDIS